MIGSERSGSTLIVEPRCLQPDAARETFASVDPHRARTTHSGAARIAKSERAVLVFENREETIEDAEFRFRLDRVRRPIGARIAARIEAADLERFVRVHAGTPRRV